MIAAGYQLNIKRSNGRGRFMVVEYGPDVDPWVSERDQLALCMTATDVVIALPSVIQV